MTSCCFITAVGYHAEACGGRREKKDVANRLCAIDRRDGR